MVFKRQCGPVNRTQDQDSADLGLLPDSDNDMASHIASVSPGTLCIAYLDAKLFKAGTVSYSVYMAYSTMGPQS